jgi:hypothetical protein
VYIHRSVRLCTRTTNRIPNHSHSLSERSECEAGIEDEDGDYKDAYNVANDEEDEEEEVDTKRANMPCDSNGHFESVIGMLATIPPKCTADNRNPACTLASTSSGGVHGCGMS